MSDMDALVEKAVEAAAIELHGWKNPDGPEWGGASERHKNRCRGAVKAQTRAALEAIGLPALLERVEAAEREVARLLTSREVLIGQRDDFAERVARVEAVRLRLNGDPEYRITQAHAGHLIRAALTEGTEG